MDTLCDFRPAGHDCFGMHGTASHSPKGVRFRVRSLDAFEPAWAQVERRYQEPLARLAEIRPGVLGPSDVTLDDGHLVLWSPMTAGLSLADRIQRGGGGYDWFRAAQTFSVVAELLQAAHDELIVHSHLTIERVILAPDSTVTLDDVLIERFAGGYRLDGVAVDRLSHLAPELLEPGGRATRASDIYALGVALIETMAARRLFVSDLPDHDESFRRIRHDEPDVIPAGLPTRLQTLVNACLEKEPANRPNSAGEVEAELRAVRSESFTDPTQARFVAHR